MEITNNNGHEVGRHDRRGFERDGLETGVLATGHVAEFWHVGEDDPVRRGGDGQIKGGLDGWFVPARKCLSASNKAFRIPADKNHGFNRVVDPNTFKFNPDTEFWHNLNPDPGLCHKFGRKKINFC